MEEEFSPKRGMRMENIFDGGARVVKYPPVNSRPIDIPTYDSTSEQTKNVDGRNWVQIKRPQFLLVQIKRPQFNKQLISKNNIVPFFYKITLFVVSFLQDRIVSFI
jgi:hypothetical protein